MVLFVQHALTHPPPPPFPVLSAQIHQCPTDTEGEHIVNEKAYVIDINGIHLLCDGFSGSTTLY